MSPKYKPGPDPGAGKAVVESFKFKKRVYELRLNACGKKNCRTCQGNIPRHGPYWYMCVPWGGKWRRIYIGKDLNTTKYIHQNGEIFTADEIKSAQGALTPLEKDTLGPTPLASESPHAPDQLDALEESGEQPPTTIDDIPFD